MESKHTPGPWDITHAIIGTVDPVKHPSAVVAAPSGSVDTICDFNWMTKRPIQEQVANARLIAAAPELLAALRPFADIGIGTNPDYRPEIRLPREAIIAARAAIARAEGDTK